MQRKILCTLLAVVLLAGLAVTAAAHPVPDPNAKGSITVTMKYDGEPVPGGSLTLYQVGVLYEDNGDYSFIPHDVFDKCVDSFDRISDPELAAQLAQFAADNKVREIAKQKISDDGVAAFFNLELGLYLLVQDTPAKGFHKIAPFLVSVPQLVDEEYIYKVDASPKFDLEVAPTTKPTGPTKPTEPNLPQTGQLSWPVPLLTIAGLALFAVGWAMRAGRKKDAHEE